MTRLVLPAHLLSETLERLRAGGRQGHERVVLWLGPAAGASSATVSEVYEPEQETAVDYFHLSANSLQALMKRLRSGRLKVAAQIHTHPGEAFHSRADDRWAIVRHVGALSLVLPRFAVSTTPVNFLDEVKTYQLSEAGKWDLTPNLGPNSRLAVRS